MSIWILFSMAVAEIFQPTKWSLVKLQLMHAWNPRLRQGWKPCLDHGFSQTGLSFIYSTCPFYWLQRKEYEAAFLGHVLVSIMIIVIAIGLILYYVSQPFIANFSDVSLINFIWICSPRKGHICGRLDSLLNMFRRYPSLGLKCNLLF